MPDESPSLTPDQLILALGQQLASLQAAGIDWLPEPALPAGASLASLFGGDAPETAALAPEPIDPLAERRQELKVLADTVAACTRCPALASTRTQTVFGVGPTDPELCLIGEAPGADEDREGEPFVGQAGQLLNRILAACGFRREDVYICNILKCRPPGNRTPQADEAENCGEYLRKQIELVRPKFICCLGGTAVKYLLNTTLSLAKMRGRVHDYHGVPVICTYHPAYLLPHRNPDPRMMQDKKKLVWDDMKFLLARMGRSVEKKS